MQENNFNDMRIFIDSDVVIASILSERGASYFLLHAPLHVDRYISNYSLSELSVVIKRKSLDYNSLDMLLASGVEVFQMRENLNSIKRKFNKYTLDIDDCHIIAGCINSSSTFLITHNTKHYKTELIKRDFGIITMKPGRFLQYVRGLEGEK